MEDTTMHQEEEDVIVDNVVEDERTTGQVKWFNDIEKYGFICPTDGSEDIFVHLTDLSPAHNKEKANVVHRRVRLFQVVHEWGKPRWNGPNQSRRRQGSFRGKPDVRPRRDILSPVLQGRLWPRQHRGQRRSSSRVKQ